MPALLMRLLLSALLILNGSADAWAAVDQASSIAMPAHCDHASTQPERDAKVAVHAGHAHHAGPQPSSHDSTAVPDCCDGQSCNHACHVPATSAAALPAALQPVAFESGQELLSISDVLFAAPPPLQPIRPPIC
jgi:hypothetical protein